MLDARRFGLALALGLALAPSSRAQVRGRAALPSVEAGVRHRAWRYVVLHHTATAGGSEASIEAAHRQRGMFRGMAYHFLIGNGHGLGDGAVVAGRRWRQQLPGAHVASALREPERGALYDEVAVGIALVGDLEAQGPTAAQRRALRELLSALQGRFHIDAAHVLGHGAVRGAHTACPGRRLGDPRALVARASPEGGPRSGRRVPAHREE